MKKDIKPIFDWAQQHGDSKITARVLVKLLPLFLKDGLEITENTINSSEKVEVSEELYEVVKTTVEELAGSSCTI